MVKLIQNIEVMYILNTPSFPDVARQWSSWKCTYYISFSSYFMHILQTCPHWLVADSHPPWKSPSWVLPRLCPAERFPLRQPNRCRVESTGLDHHRVPWSNDSLTWLTWVWDVWEYASSVWATVSNRNTVYRSSECQPATSKNDKPAITRSFQIRNIPAFCPQVFEWRWQCWWICRRPSGFCSDRWCPQIFPLCVICRHWGQTMRKTSYPPCKLFDVQLPLKTKGRNLKNGTSGKTKLQIVGFHLPFCRITQYDTCIVCVLLKVTPVTDQASAPWQVPRFSPVDGAGDAFFFFCCEWWDLHGRLWVMWVDTPSSSFIIFWQDY